MSAVALGYDNTDFDLMKHIMDAVYNVGYCIGFLEDHPATYVFKVVDYENPNTRMITIMTAVHTLCPKAFCINLTYGVYNVIIPKD